MTTVITALDLDDPTVASLRSRTSSIISTTTRFSLETLSQDDRSSILGIRERQRSRPSSHLSMTSVACPAPSYNATLDSTLVLPTHLNGNFHVASPSPVFEATTPFTAYPNDEDISPIDPEHPRAQIITYYNQIVRTLDQNYTTSLVSLRAKHAQDLATVRHDIDSAYRTQWKIKNWEIEREKEQAALTVKRMRKECDNRVVELEKELDRVNVEMAEMERMKGFAVEKARHEVEDMWERMWAERMRVEGEERQRKEREHLEQMKRIVEGVRRVGDADDRTCSAAYERRI